MSDGEHWRLECLREARNFHLGETSEEAILKTAKAFSAFVLGKSPVVLGQTHAFNDEGQEL